MMSLNSIVDLHEKWETTSVGHKMTPSKAAEHGEEEILFGHFFYARRYILP